MSILQKIIFFLFLLPIYSKFSAAQCNKDFLIDKIKSAPDLSERPSFAFKQEAMLNRIVLKSSETSNDTYKTDAIIDFNSNIAWIVTYGGFDGQDYWKGPIGIDKKSFITCPEIKQPKHIENSSQR